MSDGKTNETKICRFCQSEISKQAKICPNCRKKQSGGFFRWILLLWVIAVAFIGITLSALTSSDSDGQGETNTAEISGNALTADADEIETVSKKEYKAACTKIGYKELFRNYKEHNGEKVKFKGEIKQVIKDGDDSSEYLIAVTESEYGYYDDNVYVVLDKSKTDTKFLEGDVVKFYGEANETYSYISVLGQEIEVPRVNALYMDLKEE
jgi:RNA polymerase subunit RPABC4/transcription elongation factor Spt4